MFVGVVGNSSSDADAVDVLAEIWDESAGSVAPREAPRGKHGEEVHMGDSGSIWVVGGASWLSINPAGHIPQAVEVIVREEFANASGAEMCA